MAANKTFRATATKDFPYSPDGIATVQIHAGDEFDCDVQSSIGMAEAKLIAKPAEAVGPEARKQALEDERRRQERIALADKVQQEELAKVPPPTTSVRPPDAVRDHQHAHVDQAQPTPEQMARNVEPQSSKDLARQQTTARVAGEGSPPMPVLEQGAGEPVPGESADEGSHRRSKKS